jgi:hypothetical protein
MQKVYYFFSQSEWIPVILERDLIKDEKYTILIIENGREIRVCKDTIKYSTNKEVIESFWYDDSFKFIDNLESEFRQARDEYLKGPQFS